MPVTNVDPQFDPHYDPTQETQIEANQTSHRTDGAQQPATNSEWGGTAKKSDDEKPDRRKLIGIPLALLALLLIGAIVVFSGIIKFGDQSTQPLDEAAPLIATEEELTEAPEQPDQPDEVSTATFTPTATDTPTSTATATATATPTPALQITTAAPNLCTNNGGTANVSQVCTCQSTILVVTFCGDGTRFESPTSTACTPDASQCQGGTTGGTGGGPTCTLTVADCNALGFSSVDPVTCTCYGNYKP